MYGISELPSGIFVYGTLKRGEINHRLLVPYVRHVEAAWLQGALYDVGDFPALADGTQQVQGELVDVDPDVFPAVLQILDRLEGCIPGDDAASMYHRRIVLVTIKGGRTKNAFAYFYNGAHPDLPSLEHLRPVESGCWSGMESVGPLGTEELDAYRQYVRSYGDPLEQH